MDYCEYPAGVRLAPYVDRFWTLCGTAGELAGATQPVLPDGRPELIIHFGDPFDRLADDGAAERQAPVIFAGQLTRPLVLRPTGAAAVLGVRFHPSGAAAFLKMPQRSIAGKTPSVDELSPALARALRGVKQAAGAPSDAVPLVRAALESCLDPTGSDRRLRAAVSAILRSNGAVPIGTVAEYLSMSRRQLERRFLDQVGIPPKRLAKIARFQAALRALRAAGTRPRVSDIAARFGYADQSHLVREFREMAGCPPSGQRLAAQALTRVLLGPEDGGLQP